MRHPDQKMPLVAVVAPPRGGRDADHFARGIRALAERIGASGLALIAAHADGAPGPPTIALETDAGHPAQSKAFGLVARAADLLQKAGLSSTFGRHTPEVNLWAAMRKQHADSAYPLIEIYIPAQFGRQLMVLTTRALQPLRREGVVIVGMSGGFDLAARASLDPDHAREEEIAGAPA